MTETVAKKKKKVKKSSITREIWYRFCKNKVALLGLIILVLIILMALFADFIVPSEVAKAQSPNILAKPSAEHWFGTDEFGRDLFARIVHGSRYSLFIGVATSLIALVVGAILGASAGYFGGIVDNVICRIVDVFICVPPVLMSLAVVAALGTNMQNLIIAITISCVPGNVRLIRSVVMTVADQDYIRAAKSYGCSNPRIIFRYVLPNALSFIGMGIQPPDPEWGALLSNAQDFMFTSQYLLFFPGIFILLTSLAFNLVGDGLTDALDPRLKD